MNNGDDKKQEVLAIIPARGGSKGVLRKNIRPLAGKPLIAYTIAAALESEVLGRVIVSTDDEEIAEVARQCGAEVVDRPPELATDTALTEPVLEHLVAFLEKKENYRPGIVVLLQATSPFRSSQHIEEAMAEYLDSNYDSLLSVCSSHSFIWHVEEEGAKPLNYDFRKRPRKQDMLAEFRENGAIYITRHEVLTNEHNRLGGKIGLYVMSEEDSLEIDTEFDFWLCEQVLKRRR